VNNHNGHLDAEGGRILFAQFNDPGAFPPIEHSTRILAERGWQVLVVGASQIANNALRLPQHPLVEVRVLSNQPPGWKQKLHFLGFCLWMCILAFKRKVHWIYASDAMVCPAALILSQFARWKVLYHEHDSPVMTKGREASCFARIVLWARKKLACRAAFCVAPNAVRARALMESTGTTRPIMSVWNCPSRAEALESSSERNENGGLILFYHGSIVPARLPFSVLQAISRLPTNIRLRIAGYETIGSPGYEQHLKQKAERLEIIDRVTFLGPIPLRTDLLTHCREADVGLAFMPLQTHNLNERAMVGASNKPFDFLACGLALLVSDLADWKQMYVDTGFGRACNPDDPSSIAEEVSWFLSHPEERKAMGRLGQQRIKDSWNYETQFEKVREKLQAGKQSKTP